MISADYDAQAWASALKPPSLKVVQRELATEWKDNAAHRLREKYSGGPMSRYVTSRTGRTRRSVRSRLTPTGAALSVTGPGVFSLEDGAEILPKRGTPVRGKGGRILRYIPFLRFRLYTPTDTSQPTGRWVMARRVRIRARHPVRDSGREALASLWLDLGDL
ncbi:hypothetical protein QOL99_00180 [Deinococcus sp. MIMF12]|uniref:Uncharacterized protein n=1 Tax=Deinococcus rhizophilus TaxID=3049544 RepID=A0ABT7JC00_9DEIO|nr:hypothetical protein [Deinococcus rhizophilus]MDL2342565.1 hypothetical protein [Deinococcus rhizophilus]